MRQMTFAMAGFERYSKTTRRAAFLAEMERVVPWPALCALIDPFYPQTGNGRPPVGLERMLRIYFLQHWFNLSDPAVEEALYEWPAMRAFVGIDLGREPVPDETTVCRFRHLLEAHDLGRRIFEEVHRHLENGLKVSTGTIVDATIISAPSSTKNADKARDPDMHQTKKGNQWYFGMKAHLGVDSRSKLIHAVAATPANVADSQVLPICCMARDAGVGRPGLSRPARGHQGARAEGQDFTNRRYRQRGVVDRPSGERTDQVESAGQGRARDRHDQVRVRLRQGALSRPEQKRPPPVRGLRAGQSFIARRHRCAARGRSAPAARPKPAPTAGSHHKTPPPSGFTRRSTPAAPISMHHPTRPPLIQMFPNERPSTVPMRDV